MNSSQYINLNGINYKSDEPVLKTTNRAFLYGDALFETMLCRHNKAAWFEDHYQRLLNGMSVLKMDLKSLPPSNIIEKQIVNLINKNRLFGDVRARLTMFREDGGLYTPLSNKVNYLIEVKPLSTQGYELNTKGFLVDVYEEEQKPVNSFSQYKTASSLFFVLAGHYKQTINKDDVLITNSNHQIIEGLASNLFWVKDNVIYTPFRSSGCVNGIMRKQVIRLIKENKFNFQEVSGADIHTLLDAEEIFLTNAIQGIRWIVGLKDKRYYCKVSKEINQLLNDYLTNYMMDSPES